MGCTVAFPNFTALCLSSIPGYSHRATQNQCSWETPEQFLLWKSFKHRSGKRMNEKPGSLEWGRC